MRVKRRLLSGEEEGQPSRNRSHAFNVGVSALAEEASLDGGVGTRLFRQLEQAGLRFHFVGNSHDQHGLSLARIALDPEHPTLVVVALLLVIGVVEDPFVRAIQQAALGVLDSLFVMAGVGQAQLLSVVIFCIVIGNDDPNCPIIDSDKLTVMCIALPEILVVRGRGVDYGVQHPAPLFVYLFNK